MKGLEFVLGENFADDLKVLADFLMIFEADFVLIPDNPLSRPMASSVIGAKMIADALGVKTIATLSGSGKSKETLLSLAMGAKYAGLSGIACVGGDQREGGLSGIEVLEIVRNVDFEFKICAMGDLGNKAKSGATHAITQPVFDPCLSFYGESVLVLPNLMPIFSHSTFAKIEKNKHILGFEIPRHYQANPDLLQANKELLGAFKDFYLTPLNLKKQMKFFKELLMRP